MKRKIFSKLLEWKDSHRRKPLLLLGARQVGKTWVMKHFGESEYENVAYINFDEEPLAKELFVQDYDIDRLLLVFQAITGVDIKRNKTLIILDELQEAPRGLHSLKYFCEKAPEYHVMAAGSLLGVTLSQEESFPVGKVDMYRLYPMDFEEFMDAVGEERLCDVLRSHDHHFEEIFSVKLEELLRRYLFTGGMPEVVETYVTTNNPIAVRKIQGEIIEAYRKDISKHASKQESVRIGQVLDSLPSQLGKENKKFIYGVAKPGGRASEFEIAIQWLIDAGLIYKIPRISKICAPIKYYEDLNAFKIFLLDVGLLGCMSGVSPSSVLLSSDSLMEYKGMLAEQFVCQQLVSSGLSPCYWSNDKTPSEIDFIIQKGDEVYPVEVKASTNVRGKSISQYVKNNPGGKGIRFSLLPFKVQDWLTNYPLYSLPFCLES